MANFTGQLKTNEIFAALYNMIISQQTFADNVAEGYTELVDMARVDGSLYGDTKLYTSTDVLSSVAWATMPKPQTCSASIDRPLRRLRRFISTSSE